MAVGLSLVNRAKAAVRITSSNEAIIGEIKDLLEAFKGDLKMAGVKRINEEDALIIRAALLYVKWQFGYNNNAEAYHECYDSLKMSLALSGDYNTEIKRTDLHIGQMVEVTGTIYTSADSTQGSITKKGDAMYIVELKDDAMYKRYIGLAETKTEPVKGYASADIIQLLR